MKSSEYSIKKEESEAAYSICEAADKKFLPQSGVPALRLSWSWNRDEIHPSTILYRSELLPLWAGPSGHCHGHLSLALGCLKKKTINVGGEEIEISAVVLSGLFAFWRLYYDKRISPIHTIAETFEASIAAVMVEPVAVPEAALIFTQKTLPAPADFSPLEIIPAEDVFETVLKCMRTDGGIISPIRLMNTLKHKYYEPAGFEGKTVQERFTQLKKLLDQKRALMSVKYVIPLWSKPLVHAPEFEETAFGERVRGVVEAREEYKLIRIITLRNVRIYVARGSKAQSYIFNRFTAKDEQLVELLYEQLKMQLSQQKSSIILNAQCPGMSKIFAAWESLLLTDCMIIADAELSELKDDKFYVTGNIRILDFGGATIDIHFSKSSLESIVIAADIKVEVETFTLSNYYKELPQTINKTSVLGALDLKRQKQIQLDNYGLSFDAEVATAPEFWGSVKGGALFPGILFVHCRMTSDGTSSVFAMDADMKALRIHM